MSRFSHALNTARGRVLLGSAAAVVAVGAGGALLAPSVVGATPAPVTATLQPGQTGSYVCASPTPTPTPPALTVSADGTIATTDSGQIVNRALHVFTVHAGKVYIDGAVLSGTNGVDEIYYDASADAVYQHNTINPSAPWWTTPISNTGYQPVPDPTLGSSPTPTASSSATAPPVGNAPTLPAVQAGNTRVFGEDFNTPAALGSFNAVYGSRFWNYDGGLTTYGGGTYSTGKVLSVADGVADFYLHNENGTNYTATIVPLNAAGNDYAAFQYGEWGTAIRVPQLSGQGYKIAFLLWPTSNQWTNEVDFPEVDDLSSSVKFVSEIYDPAGNGSYGFTGPNSSSYYLADGAWHSYRLVWTPTSMTAYVDGNVLGTITGSAVPQQAMRATLQVETDYGYSPSQVTGSAHLDVAYAYVDQAN